MKQILRKTLSLFLALLLASASLTAAASEAMGEDLIKKDTPIHQSTALSTNVFWSTAYSDLRTENFITYGPNATVTPMVTYGGFLTACNTISKTAKALESQGYRVVAGLNGDFYNTSTGLPIGLVVSDGALKSTDGGYYAIGFKADGSAIIGKPAISLSANLGYNGTEADGTSVPLVRTLAAVNKARVSTGGIYLYTSEFNGNNNTGNTEAGVDVVCAVESGSLSIGGTLTLRVEQVLHTSSATAIPQGKVVLSVNSKSNSYYVDALAGENVGNLITVNISAAASGWNDVRYGVGALYSLVESGKVSSGLPTGSAPRTAVGQKADGTLIFYTVDGRQSGYSIGASMSQIASRLIELGCVSALCLDGGGSTTLTVTQPDELSAATVNKPSGGTERAVSNQIFLVSTNQSTGILDHFYVEPDNNYVLAGSKVNINASAVDSNYIPMKADYTLSASDGTVDGHVLTTPTAGGDVTVTASDGTASGSTVVHAVKSADSIAVKNGSASVSSLTLAPGGSVTLTASAVYHHFALKADAGGFTWNYSGANATVTPGGVLTATTPGSGTLTVSGGGKSVSIPVTVSRVSLSTLESFEGAVPGAASYSYGGTLSAESASDLVKYGKKSGKLDYTLGSDGNASLIFATPYPVTSAYTQVNLWVYGDNSRHALSLLSSDGTNTVTTAIGTLDFSGWKELTVKLPAGTASVTGFQIATGAGEDPQGTIYLDQMVAAYDGLVDTTSPAVKVSVSGTSVSGSVSDTADGVLPKASVSLTVDGKAVSFNYNTSTGALSASLSLSGTGGHRVTVTATDASGNIGRASADIASSSTTSAFSDTASYWGRAYVDFLKTSGVTQGYTDGTFRPNQNISRQEFAVMLYRFLGIDGSQYRNVTLPFADTAQIGDFALTAVKTLYSIGIIGGTQADGALYFYPGNSLTRAQASAMIGRTQAKGYAAASLRFSDAASIPSYATYYIQTMAAQQIISGYSDGTFRPNAKITRGQMAKILYNSL